MIWGLADKPLAGARNRGGGGGGVSRRGSSPAARGSGGKDRGDRELLGGGLLEVGGGRERGRRRSSKAGGGGELRRRRSGVGGRARIGRGGSLDHEEALLGVDLGRGGAEQGAPRQPIEDRWCSRAQGGEWGLGVGCNGEGRSGNTRWRSEWGGGKGKRE